MSAPHPIRAILVDDEHHALATLRYELERYCPEVIIEGEATSGVQALSLISELNPDLVFLDIEMPGMGGFDLLGQIPEPDFSVIFVTAYDQYALRAFRFAAIDYLLKPVDGGQLREAVNRATRQRALPERLASLGVLMHNLQAELKSHRIALPSSKGADFVNVHDILYCQAESNYTHVHLKNGRKYILAKTLKDVEQLLEGLEFFRVHQSYLVNPEHVQQYLRDDGGYVVMSDGRHVPLSKRRKDEFLSWIRSSTGKHRE